jgi:hypothetical protein
MVPELVEDTTRRFDKLSDQLSSTALIFIANVRYEKNNVKWKIINQNELIY